MVGLGNPDKKYRNTRHNTGFVAIDCMAKQVGVSVEKKKFDALTAEVTISDKRVLLMKPQTYMNLSGVSVEKAAKFYKIPSENVIVIFDDIYLSVSKLRIRRKGSHGGHNGIRSIIDYLQTDEFPRIKIGVGECPNPDYDLADWVLSTFKEEEKKEVEKTAENCLAIVKLMIEGQTDQAMRQYNS
ncbi:MAG: aminoacyl-tRNA hydrolase [Oscillospiraceae bacterium]